MRYLLDTDICSYAIRADARVEMHLRSHRRSELAISAITEGELRFGVAANPKLIAGVERWLAKIQVVDIRSEEAIAYAEIRSQLMRAGTPIGDADTWIAAHALALNLVLVTNNEREFRRVRGLRVENWTS